MCDDLITHSEYLLCFRFEFVGFVNAQYRFMMKPSGDYTVHFADPDMCVFILFYYYFYLDVDLMLADSSSGMMSYKLLSLDEPP